MWHILKFSVQFIYFYSSVLWCFYNWKGKLVFWRLNLCVKLKFWLIWFLWLRNLSPIKFFELYQKRRTLKHLSQYSQVWFSFSLSTLIEGSLPMSTVGTLSPDKLGWTGLAKSLAVEPLPPIQGCLPSATDGKFFFGLVGLTGLDNCIADGS